MQVETVTYQVNWQKFRPGYSIFIPCLHPAEAKKEVLKVTRRLKIEVLIKVTIEEGIRGLRIWRV